MDEQKDRDTERKRHRHRQRVRKKDDSNFIGSFVRQEFNNLNENSCDPARNYMFKVNNRKARTRYEIYSKLTIKKPKRPHCRRSGAFIVTLNIFHTFSRVFIDFEQVCTDWK